MKGGDSCAPRALKERFDRGEVAIIRIREL